jgi:hypothetical protein
LKKSAKALPVAVSAGFLAYKVNAANLLKSLPSPYLLFTQPSAEIESNPLRTTKYKLQRKALKGFPTS